MEALQQEETRIALTSELLRLKEVYFTIGLINKIQENLGDLRFFTGDDLKLFEIRDDIIDQLETVKKDISVLYRSFSDKADSLRKEFVGVK